MNIKAFLSITYGVYIVCSKYNEKINGYISNSVFQVTSEPARFAISCHRDNFTCEMIKQSNKFTVSVLEKDTNTELIKTFGYNSGRDINKFENVNYIFGKAGLPIVLDNTIAYLELEVINKIEVGTHFIFIGKVIESEILSENKKPLTYAYYRESKKAFAPKNAPTYIDQSKLTETKKEMISKKYICDICNNIYDPAVGDMPAGIPPGTEFDELPDTWKCPVCGAPKIKYKKLKP